MQNQLLINVARKLPRLKSLYVVMLTVLTGVQFDTHASSAGGAEASGAVAEIQFENGFLAPGSSRSVDISRFEKGNFMLAGIYSVDLYVNGDWIGRTDVPFKDAIDAPVGASATPCFDKKALTHAGVDFAKLSSEVLARLDAPGSCMPIADIIDAATSAFDFGEQRLDLSIPQVAIRRSPRGYVSPELWDKGVDASFLNYNTNLFRYKSNGRSTTMGYMGLSGGINVDVWHFRHDGAYTWGSHGSSYQSIASYMQRDLPSLSSQLVIGETFTSGELFDSVSFRGVQLATDDRMLPDSMRGYAPTVRGVATSNAKVTIKQSGVTIYETTVAPGAFEFNDLYATGYGGNLTVIVTEADGREHSFEVPYAAVPLSLRPGVNRYSVSAGALRNAQASGEPAFAQATWQRGFTNLVTGYAGVNVSEGYSALLVGGVFNTKAGAIGVDYTQAATQLPGQGQTDGGSTRISFSKDVLETGSNIAIAAYRYSTAGFYDLLSAARVRDTDKFTSGAGAFVTPRLRNRAQATLNQRLGDGAAGQISLTASTADYWNRSGSDLNYSFGYRNSFRGISYGVQANRQRNAYGQMDTQYYASATIPLGRTNPLTLSSAVTSESNGRTSLQSTLFGSAGADNNFTYGLTANRASGGKSETVNGGSANAIYRNSVAELSGSMGTGTGYSQSSVGIRGAVVMHRGGITLSQPVSETFGIVQVPDAEGIKVSNQTGVKIDGRGYAVVPYLTPYSTNTVTLDPKGMSTDVELQTTSQQVAPRAGSVAMITFATSSGRSAVIKALQGDGRALPFGADVMDESGKVVGVVGQSSKILARGLQDKGQLIVKWSDDAGALCQIPYELPARDKSSESNSYQQITSTCSTGQLRAQVATTDAEPAVAKASGAIKLVPASAANNSGVRNTGGV
ncbi:fimbria/pilus outer membrane usher protein [Dyella sp. 20L07]|uniref:fimbria/pilus outer membrane usher protein n=1 Tax=Dyella sp. 20L07 TaxID=3384240 RepID=UPI003D2A947C